jgi:hypothetical protein
VRRSTSTPWRKRLQVRASLPVGQSIEVRARSRLFGNAPAVNDVIVGGRRVPGPVVGVGFVVVAAGGRVVVGAGGPSVVVVTDVPGVVVVAPGELATVVVGAEGPAPIVVGVVGKIGVAVVVGGIGLTLLGRVRHGERRLGGCRLAARGCQRRRRSGLVARRSGRGFAGVAGLLVAGGRLGAAGDATAVPVPAATRVDREVVAVPDEGECRRRRGP